jgi:hypothetical protein
MKDARGIVSLVRKCISRTGFDRYQTSSSNHICMCVRRVAWCPLLFRLLRPLRRPSLRRSPDPSTTSLPRRKVLLVAKLTHQMFIVTVIHVVVLLDEMNCHQLISCSYGDICILNVSLQTLPMWWHRSCVPIRGDGTSKNCLQVRFSVRLLRCEWLSSMTLILHVYSLDLQHGTRGGRWGRYTPLSWKESWPSTSDSNGSRLQHSFFPLL